MLSAHEPSCNAPHRRVAGVVGTRSRRWIGFEAATVLSGCSISRIDWRKVSTSRAAAVADETLLSPTSFRGSLVLQGNVFTDCMLVIVFIIPVVYVLPCLEPSCVLFSDEVLERMQFMKELLFLVFVEDCYLLEFLVE
jgi:hypothetical protein